MEDTVIENPVEEVPTYKPTPKSELANIKSHIPISYVPDLAFRPPDRSTRSIPPNKFTYEKPTYKPTPLSILSSANKQTNSVESDNKDSARNKAIREIKLNIASVEYNPTEVSLQEDIDFEDLSAEFDLISDIIEEPVDEKQTTDAKENNEVNGDKEKPNEKSNNENKTVEKTTTSSSTEKKKKQHSNSSKNHKTKHRSSTKDKESSKDKHKKTEDKKNDKVKNDKPRDKHASSETNKHKSNKEKEERHKNKHKKSKSKDKEKHKSKSKEKLKKDSSNEEDNQADLGITPDFNYSDIEFGDEEETLLECYKIFNEYKPPIKEPEKQQSPPKEEPPEISEDPTSSKKRVAHASSNLTLKKIEHSQPKIQPSAAQVMASRFKLAKLAQGSNEQKNLMAEIKQPIKRPAPSLLEAAKLYSKKQKTVPNKPTPNLIDKILTDANKKPKKIAPVQNVMSIQRAKARIDELAKQKAQLTINKTPIQTQKGQRVAHVPDISLSDIPDVLNADKSKLPVNVRTRFLTLIADECVKMYLIKEDAYTRALNEEFTCYEKCKVLTTYKNSAMLAVNRLRKEFQEREKLGLGPLGADETSTNDKSSDARGRKFYERIKRYVLTEEDLDLHGFPRESIVPGHATIKNRKNNPQVPLPDNQRKCSRCRQLYLVDADGFPLYQQECVYHPLKKRTLRGEQTYLCCKSNYDTGCATSSTHVCELSEEAELDGYQMTMEPEKDDDPRSYAVYALDCEMCYTVKGLELTRVTIVDSECKTVYESLVKPLNAIIDYNTNFSGITKEQMDRTSTSILQVQANILHLCNSKTILIGHSLESDMKALKIIHNTIIDTSVLFPHKMGLPHKRALRVLASDYLKKIIQNNVCGHDSAEDAITCMELIKWKIKEELKVRGVK